MGVPAFYRWLHDSFPKCVTDYRESTDVEWDDEEWPPNPNGIEFDNVYLDFNQIVHNATHPSDKPAPPDLPAKLLAVCAALDRIILAARPRKLLVIAFDGVAPRAKMNQQRARRFLAAHERGQEARAQAILAATWGAPAPPASFDHNAITPGTPFMEIIAQMLRHHLAYRLGTSPALRGVTVLLSDASTPGEGEHKIVALVREQRAKPGYDPDTTHLLYGLDADLVMLGLATHERRFYILRDWVPLGRQKFAQVNAAASPRGMSPRVPCGGGWRELGYAGFPDALSVDDITCLTPHTAHTSHLPPPVLTRGSCATYAGARGTPPPGARSCRPPAPHRPTPSAPSPPPLGRARSPSFSSRCQFSANTSCIRFGRRRLLNPPGRSSQRPADVAAVAARAAAVPAACLAAAGLVEVRAGWAMGSAMGWATAGGSRNVSSTISSPSHSSYARRSRPVAVAALPFRRL